MTHARKVCLFACYDASGRISPETFRYVRELATLGLEVHLGCSGFNSIAHDDQAALATLGATAHARLNEGLDFGAWSDLIASGVTDDAGQVVLANDSVLGPFAPLAPIFTAMAGFDAWGMVQSREGRSHLQSWFIVMSGEAFRRPAVGRVFAQDFTAMTKSEIIVHGELGLGAAFEAEGLDVGARYSATFGLRPSRLLATNPMHFRWHEMLRTGAVPFVKRELVRDNPARIIGTRGWAAAVRRLYPSSEAASATTRWPAGVEPRQGLWQTLFQLAIRENRLAVIREVLISRKASPGA